MQQLDGHRARIGGCRRLAGGGHQAQMAHAAQALEHRLALCLDRGALGLRDAQRGDIQHQQSCHPYV